MTNNENTRRLTRALLLVMGVSLLVLVVPRSFLIDLLRTTWASWTWPINIGLRVIALQICLLALQRYVEQGRRSPYVLVGMPVLMLVMFLEAAAARIHESPLRLEPLLTYTGISLVLLEFARTRKLRRQRVDKQKNDQGKRQDKRGHHETLANGP